MIKRDIPLFALLRLQAFALPFSQRVGSVCHEAVIALTFSIKHHTYQLWFDRFSAQVQTNHLAIYLSRTAYLIAKLANDLEPL